MIITCPHCQTKYQVTYEAIGSAGRKVQCAQCSRAWDQKPLVPPVPETSPEAEADQLFDAMQEDALDEAMAAEEKAAAARPPAMQPAAKTPPAAGGTVDPAELRKRQAAFSRRHNAMISNLPMARLRRTARIMGVLILTGLLAGAYYGRVPIVDRYPDLAGLYEAVGLGVNVVGLDFSDLETLKTLSNGTDVLMVSAQIVGLENHPMPVPPVVVSLLNAANHAVYEWSVQPEVTDLMAGERATFDTRLTLPPGEAVRVRLSFAGGEGHVEQVDSSEATTAATAAATAEIDHAEPAQTAPAPAEHH